MIITKTPLRISFLGGGTDYPEYFRHYGGQTVGVAIDKYSYVTVNRLAPLFDYTIRVGYSRTELVESLEDIEHPAVRECLRFLRLESGLEIGYAGDLPARTGLGSSSSFTVGLLHALHAFKGELATRDQLAGEAVRVEQEMIKERVGVQDQHICAHGGFMHVQCLTSGEVRVAPIPLGVARMQVLLAHLMLMYTGIKRQAHEVLEDQLDRTRRGVIADELGRMAGLVFQALEILASERPIAEFGELLHTAWAIKRRLSDRISSLQIDEWYDRARRAGAVGGKLLGAGGGGFLLLVAPPERQAGIRAALPELRQVVFQFDHVGSHLLFYGPDGRC
jgi:D-glycero-alpha-D-manno-heptose-7-phosphate kinase